MRLLIVTPAQPRSTLGNAVTAQRYAAFFRSAGWKAVVARDFEGQDVDVLIALHARRSANAALSFRRRHPDRPLIVVLTGTDVYGQLLASAAARRALTSATAIVTLQPQAITRIPRAMRGKARSIIQSAPQTRHAGRSDLKSNRTLCVCVIGHLRSEKDPLRAAHALRLLPAPLRVRVTQAGRAIDGHYARSARRLQTRLRGRYRWLRELSRTRARRLLTWSGLMVLSSRLEGGANVLCEAIASGVPVLASKIPGNTGILGRDYPGLYPVGNTKSLAALMYRAATDRRFLDLLRRRCAALRKLVSPAREGRAWAQTLRRAKQCARLSESLSVP